MNKEPIYRVYASGKVVSEIGYIKIAKNIVRHLKESYPNVYWKKFEREEENERKKRG